MADGPVSLDATEAGRIWDWLLAEQGLSDSSRLTSACEVAERALGLHAARLPSPFTTVATRSATPGAALALLTAEPTPGLSTVRCMRKTLHVLPRRLAGAATAATAHYRLRDVARLLHNAGVAVGTAEVAVDLIKEFLGSSGSATHREIERHLVARRNPVPVARLGLKLAWERGDVGYHNGSAVWNREVRTFRLAPTGPSTPRDVGTRHLLEAYFRTYGPATVRDAAWWSGLSRTAVRAALADLDVVTLRLPWADSPFVMVRERYEAFLRADVDPDAVNLTAHEDVALKAYQESRVRYLGSLPQSAAFNPIGEVWPAVLVGGRVRGLWHWDRSAGRIRVRPLRGGARALRSSAATRRIATVSEVLRLGWSGRH